jgi:NDP-sugar pyrophosphorylase family protein
MEANLTAIIVCGGRGSRLGSLGKIINKNLLPLGNAPILFSVVRTVKRVGCVSCVFLTGHLSFQIERVIAEEINDLETLFLKDNSIRGTACSVQNAVQQLGINSFVYAHGNIAIGEESLEKVVEIIAQSPQNQSIIAVSDNETIAPTHPKVPLFNGVLGFDTSKHSPRVFSVGFGHFSNMCDFMKKHKASGGAAFEEFLLHNLADLDPIRAVNIKSDWLHLETLDFYKS